MKIPELIKALEGIDGAKSVLELLKADAVDLPDMDLKAYGAAIKKAEIDAARLNELTASVKDLTGKAGQTEALQLKVKGYEDEKREALLSGAFAEAAAKNGVRPEAISAARKLAALDKVTVDLDKKAVTGLTVDVFEPLKKDYAVLFGPPGKATETKAVQTIRALAPATGEKQTAITQTELAALPAAMRHLVSAEIMRGEERAQS